jgi:hypothetical protein
MRSSSLREIWKIGKNKQNLKIIELGGILK